MIWTYAKGTNPSTRRKEKVMIYSYENYCEGIDSLVKQINRSSRPDYLCGIARGGLIPAVQLSYKLKVPLITLDRRDARSMDAVNDILTDPRKSVIMVDEIIDSGETVNVVDSIFRRKFQWACLVYNISQPFCTDAYFHTTIDRTVDKEWVDFFWGGD
jgi:hypoxanthine phosphoribosyltransferase